ncbi:MAG: Trp biosynthesis-associated membrane protein [Jatrophihabitans sp.]|uniref:Trp biosynthesis-associated membrane protein n=1 Tax=Jatrophihabitans sp. TaxID=1932789 RepID=UPI003F8162B0
MTERRELGAALLLQLAGAGLVLFASSRAWVSLTADRPQRIPLALDVTGRTLDAAPFALALAALAGVVAVLATKGRLRQGVGVLLVVVGVAAVWRGSTSSGGVSTARAASLLEAHQRGAALTDAVIRSTTHGQWGVLTVVGGVLVALAGLTVAARGARWTGLSRRYETPAAQEAVAPDEERPGAGDLALWKALDRGDDPTA